MGWIGVDLDGTLAHHVPGQGIERIGPPVQRMLDKVMEWMRQGQEVRIFTARANYPEQIPMIRDWLLEWSIPLLEITATKDFAMIALYDDRAVQIIRNTGIEVAREVEPTLVMPSG